MVSPARRIPKRDKQAVRAAAAIQSCFRGHRVRTLKEDVLDRFAELCNRLAQETGVEAGFAWDDRIMPRAWRSDATAAAAAVTAAPTAAATNIASEAELLCYSDGEDEESLADAAAQLRPAAQVNAAEEAEELLAMERLHLEQPAGLHAPAAIPAAESPRRCSPTAAGNDSWQPMSAAKPAVSPCGKRESEVSAPSAAGPASMAARSLYVSMSGSLESLLHADNQREHLATDGEAACITQSFGAEQTPQQQQQQQQQKNSSGVSAFQSRDELLAELAWVKAALASRILLLKTDYGAAAAAAAASVV
jgi:hypothetical protein